MAETKGQPWGKPAPVSKEAFVCPRCGSDRVQSLALVHGAGMSTGRFGTFGASGDGGVGFASTVGTHQSALSAQAAPPQMQSASEPWVLCGGMAIVSLYLGSLFEYLLIGIGVALAFFVVAAISANGRRAHNETEYVKAIAKWKRSFMCERCGEVFEVRT